MRDVQVVELMKSLLCSVFVGGNGRLCRGGSMWTKFQKLELKWKERKHFYHCILPLRSIPVGAPQLWATKSHSAGLDWEPMKKKKNGRTWGQRCRKLPVYKGCLCLAKEVRLCPIINGKPLIVLKQDDDVLTFTLWQNYFNSNVGWMRERKLGVRKQ